MLALLASTVLLPSTGGTVAGAVDAVVGRASQYLPASLSRRRSSGGAPPPAAPGVSVPLRMLSGEEVPLEATADSTLAELQQDCLAVAGVPAALQRFCIQGVSLPTDGTCAPALLVDLPSLPAACLPCLMPSPPPSSHAAEEPREPGLAGLLRSTASHLSNRDRMARSLADWSSFFLLPEGVSRELRGQGLVSWARANVWQQLTEQPAPPGTVRVSGNSQWGDLEPALCA